MTDAAGLDVEQLSQLIAAQGREALVERLRAAYTEAAAAHADIVSLDESRIDALVQNAADNADGLQWRRALAGVASRELGVSVAEALSHPAVVRAQTELGAPSYEQSLTELITTPVPAPLPPAPAPPTSAYEESVAAPPEVASSPEVEVDHDADGALTAAPAQAQSGLEAPVPPRTPVAEPSAPAGPGLESDSWEDAPDEPPIPVIDGQLDLAAEAHQPEPALQTPGSPSGSTFGRDAVEEQSVPESSVAEPPAAQPIAEQTFPAYPAPAPAVEQGSSNIQADQPASFEHTRAEVPVSDDSISDELEIIEADDTMVELLPEPEPVELDTQIYDTIPLEADVVEPEGEEFVEPPTPNAAASPEVEAQPEPADAAPSELPAEPAAPPNVELPAAPTEPGVLPASTYAAQAEPASASHAPPPLTPAPPPPGFAPGPPTIESSAYADSSPEASPAVEAEASLAPSPDVAADPALEQPADAAPSPEVEAEGEVDEQAVEELRINAIHLGGVANLPTNREGLDLRLSSEGLDIMRGEDEIIGRLIWDEIEALEVPNQRKRRRGGNQPALARLVVRTRHGDASFEVPGYSSDELRDRVDLRLESYARH